MRIVSLLALTTLAAASGWGCEVPVFRYALERWYPDLYRVTFVPGPDGDSQAEAAAVREALSKAADPQVMSANLTLWDPPTAAQPPAKPGAARLEVRYPEIVRGADGPPIWSGEATRQNARRILDSPLRREIATRLLSGQSVIWLLLESGNAAADHQAEEALTAALGDARKEITISSEVTTLEALERAEPSRPVDPDNLVRGGVPLKIDFSVLRLARNDPEEELLRAMLLHMESDLADLAGQPIVFPIFGRARMLEPLVGAGIHRDNVLEYTAYICGACSCQVKEQNPGLDLLVSAAWDAVIEGSEVVVEKALPPLEGIAALLGEPAAAPKPAPVPAPTPGAATPRTVGFPLVLASALGAVLLAIALATIILLLRSRRGR